MKKDEKDQNIEVVVRVRPRNEREIRENAHVMVETEGNQLVVKQDFEKTFSFDHVFGPTDSQEKVFNAVVLNMISEVLTGYNCTIFAYGQVFYSITRPGQGKPTQWKAISSVSVKWESFLELLYTCLIVLKRRLWNLVYGFVRCTKI